MALQAILAQQRRRNASDHRADNLGATVGAGLKASPSSLTIRHALKLKSDDLYHLFSIWDEDGNGRIDERELKRALKMLGVKYADDEFRAFFELVDRDGSGDIDHEELIALLEADEPEVEAEPPPPAGSLLRRAGQVLDFLNTTSVQTVLYLAFVFIFQQLVQSLRVTEEFYLDRAWSAQFVDTLFDGEDTHFAMINSVPQIYDWGNNVLFRGLFGSMKPACGDVGPAGAFNSAAAWPAGAYSATSGSGSGSFKGGCNDDGWSDGDGEGGAGGSQPPTAFTVDELVAQYNAFDWTDGLIVRQARVQVCTISLTEFDASHRILLCPPVCPPVLPTCAAHLDQLRAHLCSYARSLHARLPPSDALATPSLFQRTSTSPRRAPLAITGPTMTRPSRTRSASSRREL